MMTKQNFLCMLLALVFYQVNCQNVSSTKAVYLEIQDLKLANQYFTPTTLLTPTKAPDARDNISVEGATYFNLDATSSKNLVRSNQVALSIPMKIGERDVSLELRQVDIHTTGFKVNNRYTAGAHYRGIVSGDASSLVSLSIFNEELIGIIYYGGENLTIGKIKNEEKLHIIYNERNQSWSTGLNCGVKDDGLAYTPEQLLPPSADRTAGDCIKEEINIHQSLTTELGGVTQATNYATGLFNNHKTLCANDGFTVTLSQLNVWSTGNPAPWATDEFMTLDNWQAATGAINGDLAYCAFYEPGFGGGIAASIGGLCQPNPDGSKSVGGHVGTYQNVPVYSQDVFLFSHEMGHLFGSRHTHACVWNGNGTAIDGCAGFIEGTCSIPPAASPGTIMSYCAPDVDFTEGFHPQVKNAILNHLAGSTCTSPCGTAEPTCTDGVQNGQETGVDCGGPDCDPCSVEPTCTDGIQNGQETGIDCGGPDCDPCSVEPTCTDGVQNGQETGVDCGGPDCDPCSVSTCTDVTISITLDNYPEETTWSLLDNNGTVIASGGPYGNEPDGSTITSVNCLDDGCYDFVINDTYGDGICCAYGQGSYTVTSENGDVLASGGEFNEEEVTNFCLTGTSTPTCSDGIQNGQETGIDCGGPDCEPCSTACNDVDVEIVLDDYPGETEWNIRNANNEVVASGGPYGQNSPGETISVSECLPDGCYDFEIFDSYGDGICCAYGNGSYEVSSDGSVLASGGAFGYNEVSNFCIPGEEARQFKLENTLTLTFSPNPVKDLLIIKTNKPQANVQILGLKGNVVRNIQTNNVQTEISVRDLNSGLYFINVQHEDEVIREKFIKVD